MGKRKKLLFGQDLLQLLQLLAAQYCPFPFQAFSIFHILQIVLSDPALWRLDGATSVFVTGKLTE
jgi:hypothetical protein